MGQLRNNKGFTLIEMLVVLTVLSLIVNITFVHFESFLQLNKERHFIELFSNDLLYAQEYAYTNEASVVVTIHSVDHYYTIFANYFDELRIVYFDEDFKFEAGSLKMVINYNAKGNIANSGSLILYTPKNTYKFIFNIGRGRVNVQKF